MVSLGIAVITVIAVFAVLRANVQRLIKKSDDHTNDLTLIKNQMVKFASMKEVREEFVSREVFTQIQRHFDDKFKRLEGGVNKILEKLEK